MSIIVPINQYTMQDLVRTKMKKKGLSVRALAVLASVAPSTIQKLVSGSDVKLSTFVKVSKVLDIEVQ